MQALEKMLINCDLCQLDCGNNRIENQIARCYSGILPVVSSYTKHFGEEPAIVGKRGAGLIFFGNCNSRNKPFIYDDLQGGDLIVDGF